MKTHLTPQQWGLLIGQEVIGPMGIGTLISVSDTMIGVKTDADNAPITWGLNFNEDSNCKPILRRMESMTDEEAKALDVVYECDMIHYMGGCLPRLPETIRIISAGFDLLGWIDQGLAVDRDTLRNESHIAKITSDGQTETLHVDGELVSQRAVKRTIPEYVTEEMVKAAKEDYLKHFSILNLHSSPDLYVIVLDKHNRYLDLLRRYQEQSNTKG